MESQLPPVRPYHPTTFLDRGAAVPFTTPVLGGARARPDQHGALELVIPNPSGGRGVYVLPWTGITALCRPTLHDRVFNERIAGLPAVSPSAIRHVARRVAAEGLAGEDARQSALLAAEGEDRSRIVAAYHMLMRLVAQVEREAPTPPPADAEARAHAATHAASAWIGRTPSWIANSLEELAEAFSCLETSQDRPGPTAQDHTATGRVMGLLATLGRVRGEIAEWAAGQPNEDVAAYARMICSVAQLTVSLAATTVAAAEALASDMLALLHRWSADPAAVAQIAARPEWLLDGWERICLIWGLAETDGDRRLALVEIANLVPILPKEVREWCDHPADLDEPSRFRRMIPLHEDWLTGLVAFDIVARNERIVAECV